MSFTREPDWADVSENLRAELEPAWRSQKIKPRQPLNADLRQARWKRDPQPYSFDEALQIVERFPELPLSIGITLRREDNLTVIDLDSVLTAYGEIIGNTELTTEEVEWILERTDSYTEVSSSGFGLHVFVKAQYPFNNQRPFEIAGRDKYIVLTGNIWKNQREVKANQPAIEEIHQKYFAKAELQEHFKSRPTIKHGSVTSIIVGPQVFKEFKSLFSLEFWGVFYFALYELLYGERPKVFGLACNLLSVLRKEKHPSFRLVENRKYSEIEAFDFAIANKPFRIQEVYHGFVTGKVKHLSNKELSEWTWRLIRDFDVWFSDAWEYKGKVEKFLESIQGSQGLQRAPGFMKVFQVIADHLITFARFQSKEAILTARRLAELTGIDYKLTNKALNILATCGLFEKGKPYSVATGRTYLILPVLNFDLERALDIFNRIQRYLRGRGGLKRFSRKTVKAIGLSELVNKVFRAQEISFLSPHVF